MKEIVFDLLCVGRPAKIFLSHGPEVIMFTCVPVIFIYELYTVNQLMVVCTNSCILSSEDEHWSASIPSDSRQPATEGRGPTNAPDTGHPPLWEHRPGQEDLP